jgi:hypothetical protein
MGGGAHPSRVPGAASGSPSVAILPTNELKGQTWSLTEGKQLGRVANKLVLKGGNRIPSAGPAGGAVTFSPAEAILS